jgi:hypothetical protein
MSKGRKRPRIVVRVRPEDARALVTWWPFKAEPGEPLGMVHSRQAAGRVVAALSKALLKWDNRDVAPAGSHYQVPTGAGDE